MSVKEKMDLLKSQADLVERSAQDFLNCVNEFFSILPKKKDLAETYIEEVSLDEKLDCEPNEVLERAVKLQGELDAEKEAMEKEIELLEKEKLDLEQDPRSKLSKMQEELKEQEQLLKCYRTLLPVEFDYSSDKLSGIMLNKQTGEYHGFVLDPENIEDNREYLWKQLERLFLKEGSD